MCSSLTSKLLWNLFVSAIRMFVFLDLLALVFACLVTALYGSCFLRCMNEYKVIYLYSATLHYVIDLFRGIDHTWRLSVCNFAGVFRRYTSSSAGKEHTLERCASWNDVRDISLIFVRAQQSIKIKLNPHFLTSRRTCGNCNQRSYTKEAQ